MAYLLIIAGFALLTFCAEILVRGSVALAERLGISPLVVGLTVVAFGTSAPELVVSITAALGGSPSITVGNIVGSNIANVILILGITGMVWPIPCANPKQFTKDSLLLLFTSAIFAGVVLMGTIVLWHGVVMVVMLVSFLFYSYWREKGQEESPHVQDLEDHEQMKEKPWLLIIGAVVIGLAGVIWGADLLVEGAVSIARDFGVSEEVIGLTMVAFGTSLPELATSMAAAFRKHTELALGNIIGSCMFNILGIMGITAIITPITVPPQIIGFDVWVMVLSAGLLIPFILGNGRLSRVEAAALFGMYMIYIGAQFYGVSALVPWDVV